VPVNSGPGSLGMAGVAAGVPAAAEPESMIFTVKVVVTVVMGLSVLAA